jgi:type IV pilus assembly protein PilE
MGREWHWRGVSAAAPDSATVGAPLRLTLLCGRNRLSSICETANEMTAMGRPRSTGFTLIELMIVVVIVSILATVGYPSYLDHVRKTRRSDAQAALLRVAQSLERCYTEYNAYNDAGCAAVDGTGLATAYQATEGGYYTLSATALSASGFTLQAAPNGDQANDKCGRLRYNSAGQKGVTADANEDGSAGNAADVAICW